MVNILVVVFIKSYFGAAAPLALMCSAEWSGFRISFALVGSI
jgi:hypothetical protein